MAGETPDILKRILQRKAEEVEERSRRVPLHELGRRAERAPAVRPFAAALSDTLTQGRVAVIAEIKKASPSKGLLRAAFDPRALAESYAHAGATALSVLTDESFFQGTDDFLTQAREACTLPVLRKEFIIDDYQLYESRALGADCVLLIVAALGDAQLTELSGLARHLDMDVLVEVHDDEELQRALALDARLIGINNRDLRTFETSLEVTLALRGRVPEDRLVVTESGIHTAADVALMREHGVHVFLVGEAFMQALDPGERLRELFDLS